ncbi:MAG TPA: hypothetical protein VL475_11715, partial [Planctomycetaceae bacterium]|nr:hypothetical protein [Planctomycetaceae bacterium]
MSLPSLLERLLPLDDVQSIDRLEFSWGTPWAREHPTWLLWSCLGLAIFAVLFYSRWQTGSRRPLRWALACLRAPLLALLLVLLADPVAIVRLTHTPRPWLWVLFDGTDSMGIRDEYPEAERHRLSETTGLPATTGSTTDDRPTRMEYVQALLRKPDANLFTELAAKYRLKAFLLERADAVREIGAATTEVSPDPREWAPLLTTNGPVTALGRGFEDLALRRPPGHLGGVLVFSDFDQNSGPPAVAAAKRLGAPVFTFGIGARIATDVAVDLQVPLLLKKAERGTLTVMLRSADATGQDATIRLTARRITDMAANTGNAEPELIGERTVALSGAEQPVEFTWIPAETGRYALIADVVPLSGELITENNRAEREIEVRDDYLRLLFVEYEPTWEWRFIKEVFHRDKLVGLRGFRTYLRSADPKVRQSDELFLPQLATRRSEFFANDVIFLGDVPASTLTARFCDMTREFVGKFGGGLVVLSGPRFGPAELAGTPLAELLPVVVDPTARPRDGNGFRPQFTADAIAYDFMRLGVDERENDAAWNNLGLLPWYQPVSRLHPLATALAVHPIDKCSDGKSPQPLIAVRRYGKGEVIYLAFNETWRLRRKYGELFYRQFWGQMIHRLGLSHALGSQKRFVVRTDRQHYQPDDRVLLTVEAVDANFEPLTPRDLPQGALSAEWIPPAGSDGKRDLQTLSIPQTRDGVFETTFAALTPGEHRLAVTDPVTQQKSEVFFNVASVSVERRSAVRNAGLQEELASATGGRSYDLTTVADFVADFQPEPPTETSLKIISLWNTWVTF